MKIPKDLADRDSLYQETVEACFASAQKRKTWYSMLMHYFEFGCDPVEGAAVFNKIEPTIDTLTAFLYGVDTTRFSCHLGPEVPKSEWAKVPTVAKAVNSAWLNSNAGLVFGSGLQLSLTYGSAFVKLIIKDKQLQPFVLEPHCVGVYREDANYLDRQEAIAHRYQITKSQLENDLFSHPDREKILASLPAKPIKDANDYPDTLRQIIVTNTTQNGIGPITPGNTTRGNGGFALNAEVEYKPLVATEMIDMCELSIWDDDIGDYRKVTRANDCVTIYDRPNFFVKQELDLIHICPFPKQGYFWGTSMVGKMVGLQQLRNRRMGQIDHLLEKQVDPPISLEGFDGIADEIANTLNTPGSAANLGQMGKANPLRPTVPEDVYAEIHEIDAMFSETSGLQNLLMGKGESGVRSGRQTSELARLGSARIKQRSLIVEDSLSTLATKYFKALRKYSKDILTTDKNLKFILDQMDDSTVVKVDAHSSSPLFVEDQKQVATELLESGSISKRAFLDLMNPPGKEVLQRELPELEAKQAAAAKMKEESAKPNKK